MTFFTLSGYRYQRPLMQWMGYYSKKKGWHSHDDSEAAKFPLTQESFDMAKELATDLNALILNYRGRSFTVGPAFIYCFREHRLPILDLLPILADEPQSAIAEVKLP